jgi:hypothetical protein
MKSGTLFCFLYNVQSRSISPENFTGEKGRGGMATNNPRRGFNCCIE